MLPNMSDTNSVSREEFEELRKQVVDLNKHLEELERVTVNDVRARITELETRSGIVPQT
jgi:hypothetical protein